MLYKLTNLSRWRLTLAAIITVIACALPLVVHAVGEGEGEVASYAPPLYGTFWSLVPPIVAIILALVTKEVFSSLFLGILIGGVFWAAGPNPAVYDEAGEAVWESSNIFTGTINHIVRDGFLTTLTDGWNIGIVIFLCVLGMIVAMMAKVGGSRAFGEWASKKIKSRVGAQLALMLFHLFIFIDDYFACLTVGSVMRPVTDRAKVSRAKLAYLIDGTAAPICILAPISTWAAAVASYIPEEGAGSDINGFTMFIKAIPWNFYAILTIIMILILVLLRFDYGPMAKHEYNAEVNNDLFTTPDRPYSEEAAEMDKEVAEEKGRVYDLIFPIAVLIVSCVIALIYTGGFFAEGDAHFNFVEAFSGSDAATGLVIGSIFSIVIIIIYYIARRLLPIRELTNVIPKGIHAMASPILILSFAWTLKAMTDTMGSSDFVSAALEGPAQTLQNFLPAIVFLVAAGIAFSTGTSWGTYGIVIPIVAAVFAGVDEELLVIGIAACLAGGVMGDHCSPISDTTIMASAGAQCNHINHVNTQLPYALTVAAFSFVMYLIGGFVRNAFIMLPLAIILFILLLFVVKKLFGKTIDKSKIEA
ncbi:MAG: Na+/H+ antiporter NhaC family protein [Clostridiales Family XIII bacterium]|jgi:Na+/H+ antiporter NhaC|nr:Na+/H+ antiporter NhaC family protein [Clostridiales Family XIII bacterium]